MPRLGDMGGMDSGVGRHESCVACDVVAGTIPATIGVGQGRLGGEKRASSHYLTIGVLFGGRSRTDNTKPALPMA